MMPPSLALHTAARRYCQDRSDYWYQFATEQRQMRLGNPGSDQLDDRHRSKQTLLDSYARSKLLTIIGTELERLDPHRLGDLETTRQLIVRIGQVAQAVPPRANMGQTTVRQVVQPTFGIDTTAAIADERATFCTYIETLANSQLASVEPLPYRRVLDPEASHHIWQQLRQRWQITGEYWHPLMQCQLPDITAFDAEAFQVFCAATSLVELLSARGVTRIWELHDYGVEYEQDAALFDPRYNGDEGYWTSDGLDWIVYVSHEASITVGGWVGDWIKAQWPDWEQHLWSA